jgi:hypothetical protein
VKHKNFETLLKNEDMDWICFHCKPNLKTTKIQVSPKSESSAEIKELSKEIRELKDSIQFISKQYEDIKLLVSELMGVKEENRDLKSKVNSLQMHCNKLEQYSKNYNLEISGVPFSKDENTYEIVDKIFKKIGADAGLEDIEYCHRVTQKRKSSTSKEASPKIVAKLFSRQKKQNIMNKIKQNKKLMCGDLPGFTGNAPIFLNEHLSSYNAQLFWMARNLRGAGYKFVWVKDGQVKIRKDEHSKVINIECIEDLPKVAGVNMQQSG